MTTDNADSAANAEAERLERLACIEFVELVTDYFEGTLPPAERDRFEAHFAVCAPCSTYLDQMRQTIEAAGRLDPEAVPAEGKKRLLGLFRSYRGS
jgi:anti-sigma factor RsiW